MKGFCCNVPENAMGRLPYQNTLTQKPGLSPKSPAVHHGIFGPHMCGSYIDRGMTASTNKKTQQKPNIKSFKRPMLGEAEKCQVRLH